MRRVAQILRQVGACALLAGFAGTSHGAETESADTEPSALTGSRHVLILAGLPGDTERELQFDAVLDAWHVWVAAGLGIPQENVRTLRGWRSETNTVQEGLAERELDGEGDPPATAEVIRAAFQDLSERLAEEDSLWVFFLGHANYDEENVYFHISGPDLSGQDYAALLALFPCREQVIWITTSSSGWFLRPLAREGRIVITATAAQAEPNETEFPLALSTVMQLAREEVDQDGDDQVSLLEFMGRVVEEVEARYAADQRAPTEHAQLDDNGDGRGTEWPELKKLLESQDAARANEQSTQSEQPAVAPRPRDGETASALHLPWPLTIEAEDTVETVVDDAVLPPEEERGETTNED